MFNFITTGCSFTAGIIPLPHNSQDDWNIKGSTWPHFLFANMSPEKDKFTNFAMPGGGNIAATANLIYYLETNKLLIRPDNTIIGINITGLNRLDVMCDVNNDQINVDLCCIDSSGIDHPSKELGFGWVTHCNNHRNKHVDIQNCLSILQCFSYLDLHKFQYFFMVMNDDIYSDSPSWFKDTLDQHSDKWIKFGDITGMMEFAKSKKLTKSSTDHHPTIEGHKLIANYIIDFLKKKEIFNE
jgi:hypothetical protein